MASLMTSRYRSSFGLGNARLGSVFRLIKSVSSNPAAAGRSVLVSLVSRPTTSSNRRLVHERYVASKINAHSVTSSSRNLTQLSSSAYWCIVASSYSSRAGLAGDQSPSFWRYNPPPVTTIPYKQRILKGKLTVIAGIEVTASRTRAPFAVGSNQARMTSRSAISVALSVAQPAAANLLSRES